MTAAPVERPRRGRVAYLATLAAVLVIGTTCAIAGMSYPLRSWVLGHYDVWELRAELRSLDAASRAHRLGGIGPRRHQAVRKLLLDYAGGPIDEPDTQAAQLALMYHHPGTWPARARAEYRRLGALDTDPRRPCADGGAWWDPDCPGWRPPGRAADWDRFLTTNRRFVLADEAHVQRARAHHREGAPDRVLPDLERALEAGDASSKYLAESLAATYARRWMPEAQLDRAARQRWTRDEIACAVAQSRAWRRLERLEIATAQSVVTEALRSRPACADHGVDRELIEGPGLLELERRWRAAVARGDQAATERAFVDLAWALTVLPIQGPRGGGFPQPRDGTFAGRVWHSRVLLEPLDRIATSGIDRITRLDAELLAALGYAHAVSLVCAGSPPHDTESWVREGARRFRLLAQRSPTSVHGSFAAEHAEILEAVTFTTATSIDDRRCNFGPEYAMPPIGPGLTPPVPFSIRASP